MITAPWESVSQIAFHSHGRNGRGTSWGWWPLALNLEVQRGGGDTRDYRLSLERHSQGEPGNALCEQRRPATLILHSRPLNKSHTVRCLAGLRREGLPVPLHFNDFRVLTKPASRSRLRLFPAARSWGPYSGTVCLYLTWRHSQTLGLPPQSGSVPRKSTPASADISLPTESQTAA